MVTEFGSQTQRGLVREVKSPKIYVYNISETHRSNREAYEWMHTSLYGLEIVFPTLLLDSPYVTDNPEEADYFYIWAWLYYSTDRKLEGVLSEISKLPYWERKGGKDHIFTIVHDEGLCDWKQQNRFGPIRDSIIMQHWGKVTGIPIDNPCHMVDKWAASCDQVFRMVDAQTAGHEPFPCYVKGKDLLVPTITSENTETTPYLNPALNVNKTTLIIFGGGINKTHLSSEEHPERDAGYSFGVRQTFARLYHGHPGVKIFYEMVPDYWEHFSASTFCLAPAGWGWGARVKSAVTRGCIPVIIQDGIKVEWEDDLPLQEYAVRVPFMYIHRLPEILHRIERVPGRIAQMRRNLECVWQLHWWNRPHGRAFEMTMCVLKARLHNTQPRLDLRVCRLFCGTDEAVNFKHGETGINSI
ncbi:hypothetical protein FOA52_011063 [Chlamydomonas sp. UWO 241]|nr:hypothetical protein FOA52_011063 [Chlamydomonas sp. UWO 241]